MIHHADLVSVLPLGAALRCCHGLWSWLWRRLRLGFWNVKVLADCIIIYDVPCEMEEVVQEQLFASEYCKLGGTNMKFKCPSAQGGV